MYLINQPCLPPELKQELHDYPSPASLLYLWGFGSLAGICFLGQFITGIFLAMHYAPDVNIAFYSVERIVRDVPAGWLMRCIHINGASFFFLLMYAHAARSLFYTSYVPPRSKIWNVGVLVFLIAMATAFFGYILPWGQMSFWAATVITNLLSGLPIGSWSQFLVVWIWGGYSVGNPTLNRFFSLHYLFPFLILFIVGYHIHVLHKKGSTVPIIRSKTVDCIRFHPSYPLKDIGFLFFVIYFFVFFFCRTPDMLVESANYVRADPLVTPNHIIPEWYFLPFYGLLRSIPNKVLGLFLMALAISCFFLLPLLVYKRCDKYTKHIRAGFWTSDYLILYREKVLFFIFVFMGLMEAGNLPFNPTVETAGQIFIFLYFWFFLHIPFLIYRDHVAFKKFMEETYCFFPQRKSYYDRLTRYNEQKLTRKLKSQAEIEEWRLREKMLIEKQKENERLKKEKEEIRLSVAKLRAEFIQKKKAKEFENLLAGVRKSMKKNLDFSRYPWKRKIFII